MPEKNEGVSEDLQEKNKRWDYELIGKDSIQKKKTRSKKEKAGLKKSALSSTIK